MTARNNPPCPNASTSVTSNPYPNANNPGNSNPVTSNNADTDRVRQKQRSTDIQKLNDRLRKTGRGGRVQFTEAILAQGPDFALAVFTAVEAFSSFNCHNDPWGEHDCATLMVEDQKILWKIDYYDNTLTFHSPDASNPKATKRIMTVMLAEEY